MKKLINIVCLSLMISSNAAQAACLIDRESNKVCEKQTVKLEGFNASGEVISVDEQTGVLMIQLNPSELNQLSKCHVELSPLPGPHNPHREYDRRFRACKQKALTLDLPRVDYQACVATCMKH